MKKILDSILKKIGDGEIIDSLTRKLSNSELQTFFLELFEKKAAKITPSDLLKNYENNRFVQPCNISQISFLKAEMMLSELLSKQFEALELSPLAPLGCCSAVGTVHQNKVISAARNTEIVSDTTNVLALECALRRRKNRKSKDLVKLYTSHRVTRGQKFDNPSFTSHFKLLSLCTAGRDYGNSVFEVENLIEHNMFHIRALEKFKGDKDTIKIFFYTFGKVNNQIIVNMVIGVLKEIYSSVEFVIDNTEKSGGNYYQNIRFIPGIEDEQKQFIGYCDGGLTDWTQKLLSDKKERLLTSGIGIELLIRLKGKPKD